MKPLRRTWVERLEPVAEFLTLVAWILLILAVGFFTTYQPVPQP